MGEAERKANLRALVEKWGGASSLAKKLTHSGPSYLSQMLTGVRPITEKTARQIETRLELPRGWLDQDHSASDHAAQDIDQALITKVIVAVGTALEANGKHVTPARFADMVALVYTTATKNGEVDSALVQQVVKLAT